MNKEELASYKEFKSSWIREGVIDASVHYAEYWGHELAKMPKPLTSSQIRNSFGEVRRIQQKTLRLQRTDALPQEAQTALALLRPKLAYATARSRSKEEPTGASCLEEQLEKALNQIEGGKPEGVRRFHNFCDLFEAILAYHKKYGGE